MALICAHAGFWPPGLEAKTRGSNLDLAAQKGTIKNYGESISI